MSPDKGSGCLDLLAVGVPTWVITFLVSLVGGWAIGDFITGDKCDGAAAETFCGFGWGMGPLVFAPVIATIVTVVAVSIARKSR